MKTKITFFLANLEVGGAEHVTVNLLSKLDKSKFDLELILGKSIGYYMEKLPPEVLVTNFNTYGSLSLFLKLYNLFSDNKNDECIFVPIFPRLSVITMFAKLVSRSKVKIIIIEHSIFSKTALNASTLFKKIVALSIFPSLMRLLYKKAECVVCVSKGVAKDINQITGLGDKIKVIYNPIIDNQIDILAKENVSHPWFSGNIPVILAVGRLVKAKDYPNLLKAFSYALKKTDARLVIIGDGLQKNKLLKLSEKLEINKNVDFIGLQKNPYKFMSRADIFVLSSQQEGFSTVIIEAMRCGAPVISTDYEVGLKEIIKDNESGLIVPVGDSEALSNAIIKLLTSPALREKFGKEGKERAGEFTIDKKTKEYEKLFLEIANKDV